MKPSEEVAVGYLGQIRASCGPSDVAVWMPKDSECLKAGDSFP